MKTSPQEVHSSTLPPKDGTSERRRWLLRGAGVFGLVMFVFLASLTTESERVAQASGSMEAALTYGLFARRGEPSPLHLRIQGASGPALTVWVSTPYLAELDFNSWYPEPDRFGSRPGSIGLVYPEPPHTFDLMLDARYSTDAAPGRKSLEVEVESETDVIRFEVETWMLP